MVDSERSLTDTNTNEIRGEEEPEVVVLSEENINNELDNNGGCNDGGGDDNDDDDDKASKTSLSRNSSLGSLSRLSMKPQEIQEEEENRLHENVNVMGDLDEAIDEEKTEVSNDTWSPSDGDVTNSAITAVPTELNGATVSSNRLLAITAAHRGGAEFRTAFGQSSARESLTLRYSERFRLKMSRHEESTVSTTTASSSDDQRSNNNIHTFENTSQEQCFVSSQNNNSNSQTNSLAPIDSLTAINGNHDEQEEISRPGAFPTHGPPPGQTPQWSRNNLIPPQQRSPEANNSRPFRHRQDCESSQEIVQPVAEVVDNESFLRTFLENTAIAEVVDTEHNKRQEKIKKYALLLAVAAVSIIIGVSVGLGRQKHTKHDAPSTSPTFSSSPTLEVIQNRGELLCESRSKSGVRGFTEILCRGLAAAIFNNESKYTPIRTGGSDPYKMLYDEDVDIATSAIRIKMDNDVYQKSTKKGYTFTSPFYYDGIGFGGESLYLGCASELNGFFPPCKGIRICVRFQEEFDTVTEWFPSYMVKMVSNVSDYYEHFQTGKCNVLAGISLDISKERLIAATNNVTYHSTYNVSELKISRQVSAFVTRENDQQWSDFVKWNLQAMFVAEERNITKTNAEEIGTTDVFGPQYENTFINFIRAVGNYGTVKKDTNINAFHNSKLMELNDGSSGLIYYLPFGEDIAEVGPSPNPESTMYSITTKRKNLRCGVPTMVESEDWRNLGKEYCKAVAGSLFGRNTTNKIEFINFTTEEDGFTKLDNMEVDLLVGSRVTLRADVKEASTQKGFSFSLPYFYTNPKEDGNFTHGESIALVTREDDSQWSDFVFWIVSATFYAEEKQITKEKSEDMPIVNLFSTQYGTMFQDAISIVGHYGEMFHRSVTVTREKRNMLNENPFSPQINAMYLD